MPFSDDFSTIHSCNTVAGTGDPGGTITAGRGNATNIAVSTGNGDYTPIEGADCVEWGGGTGNQINSVYFPIPGGVDITGEHLYFWFFYAKGKGGAYIADVNGLQIRLISDTTWSATPTNYVDFYLAGEIDIPSAWSLHVVSGDADDADASGGTFNPADVRFIEVAVDQAATNDSGSTGTNRFALDFFRSGTGITITGAETPASIEAAYGLGSIHGVWEPLASLGGSVINKLCKVTVGNGAAASSFSLEGLVVYDNQKSDDAKFGWAVNGGGAGLSTLRFGEKISGPGYKFGSSGCQLISSPKGASFTRPNIAVNGNNAELLLYGSLVKGFGDIEFGVTGNPTIEVIDAEFDDCTIVDSQTSGLTFVQSKVHDCVASGPALAIRVAPTEVDALSIYNNTGDGLFLDGLSDLSNISNVNLIANNDGLILNVAGTYPQNGFRFSANLFDIFYDATSGTVTYNADTVDPPTTSRVTGGTAAVNIVAGQKTFSFTVDPSIVGYEWRLYEADPTQGTIGLVELDGGETATQDNQTYSYTYTVDTLVALQIIEPGYEEFLRYYTLGAVNQAVTVNLEVETN